MSSTRFGSPSAPDLMIRSYSSTVIRWSGGGDGGEVVGRVGAIVAMGLLRSLFDLPLTLAALTAIVFDPAEARKPGPARSDAISRPPRSGAGASSGRGSPRRLP